MEKGDVEKLIRSHSDRVSFKKNKGTSAVWPSYLLINIDNEVSGFVRCVTCDVVLKWKSKDGTSGLSVHLKACKGSEGSKIQTLTGME